MEHLAQISGSLLDDARARASRIKLMAFDVDGVLSEGTLFYSDAGVEMKAFNCLDGLGLNLLQKSGVAVAILTGRNAPCVEIRMQDLGINLVFQGVKNKLETMNELLGKLGLGQGRHDGAAFAINRKISRRRRSLRPGN